MGLLLARVADDNRKVVLGAPIPEFNDNKVDTTKYNLLTFLPKSILLQFLRLSNVVFLVNAVLQSIPIISSLSPLTAIGGKHMTIERVEHNHNCFHSWYLHFRIEALITGRIKKKNLNAILVFIASSKRGYDSPVFDCGQLIFWNGLK